MRTIAAVTVGRSDWGIYRPVLRAIQDDPALKLRLIVSGAHLAAGTTSIETIERDGFTVNNRVEMLVANDTPAAISMSMGLGAINFARSYESNRPDILLVLGDRFEMHAAAVAAVPFQIPIAHIHGGELTFGAIDEAFRHAITKYSSLHFPSTQEHADRIQQLGEEPWRITVSGAPGLDNLGDFVPLSRDEITGRLGMSLDDDPLLLTFHPVTREYDDAGTQTEAVLAAIEAFDGPIVITQPNVDTGNRAVFDRLAAFASHRPRTVLVEQLGTQAYFSLMRFAAAMIGNSSSGIIEAASFGLPVVNIGIRQDGRPRSANVIDVLCEQEAIEAALGQACGDRFRRVAKQVTNIYGDGTASSRIVARLRDVSLDDALVIKRFHDIERSAAEASIAA